MTISLRYKDTLSVIFSNIFILKHPSMTLDILICSLNKGVVRIQDVLLPPQPNVHYIVSYQYTDERYLDLIPQALGARPDVSVYTYKGQGLSANRNLALDKATADIIMYADDDAHILPETPSLVMRRFEENPQYDVLFSKHQLTQTNL